ncbi:hypothetical protein DOT_1493 [Desulfosporosinus sp. OT]|nr:hypothetical protein DOT_1493 [Desulfosporosinus sp. OT]
MSTPPIEYRLVPYFFSNTSKLLTWRKNMQLNTLHLFHFYPLFPCNMNAKRASKNAPLIPHQSRRFNQAPLKTPHLFLKLQDHVIPDRISMSRFRYAFVNKAKGLIVFDKFILAGQDYTLAACGLCHSNHMHHKLCGNPFSSITRVNIEPENSLIIAVGNMIVRIFEHFVENHRTVSNTAIYQPDYLMLNFSNKKGFR